MLRWAWLWIAVAGGCGAQEAAETTPADDLAALTDLTRQHREAVQVDTDLAHILVLESQYAADWQAIAKPCGAELDQDCVVATTGEMSAGEWMDSATRAVEDHVALQGESGSFMDAWMSEDDHHDDLGTLLDSLGTAIDDQCP